MPGVFDMQLEQLRERFGDVQTRQLPSGTTLVIVSGVRLPEGWSKPSTTIRFIVPPGYPFAQLDCFWAENGGEKVDHGSGGMSPLRAA